MKKIFYIGIGTILAGAAVLAFSGVTPPVLGVNQVALKNTAQCGKYGLVEVLNKDGTLNRQYKITAEELAALNASGNGVPPGLTKEEWTSGRAVVGGKCFDVGDTMIDAGGNLIVKYAETFDGVGYNESYAVFAPDEWTGGADSPSVTGLKLAESGNLEQNKILSAIADKDIASIQNGVLTVQAKPVGAVPKALAAVAFDAVGAYGTNLFTNTVTYSHTCTGSNLFLAVGATNYDASVTTVSSITYNSVAMSVVTSAVKTFAGNFRVEGWGLAGPATGANNVVVTWAASQLFVGSDSMSFTGVDQTTPTSGGASNSGTGTGPTLDVSSATNDMVVDFVHANGNSSSTSSQTEKFDHGTVLPSDFAGAIASGATTVTMGHTVSSSNDWGEVGFNIKAVAAASTFVNGLKVIIDQGED